MQSPDVRTVEVPEAVTPDSHPKPIKRAVAVAVLATAVGIGAGACTHSNPCNTMQGPVPGVCG